MHILISLEDLADGCIEVKTIAHQLKAGQLHSATPASQCADFLQKAIEVWQVTHDMDMPQAQQFIQSLVKQPAKHH